MSELKKDVYFESLTDAIVTVEMHLNHIQQINNNDEIELSYKQKDIDKTKLNLELSLATLCILLRKMSENHIITLEDQLRKDINSIIHSNRFDYDEVIYAYSRNGKEEVDLNAILNLAKKYAK